MKPFSHWNQPEKIEKLIKRLVKIPSVTGSIGEIKFAEALIEIIKEMPYFTAQPQQVWKHPITDDEQGERPLFVYIEGRIRRDGRFYC